MKPPLPGLVGSFSHLDTLLEAIKRMHEAGYWEMQALSPVPHHAIDEALEKPPSNVRVYTLIGCLLGATIGFVLTIATTLHYPLIMGGRPIISIPPFLVIVFELTILFGGLLTLGAMALYARLPRLKSVPAYNPRFSEDLFGLWVKCEVENHDAVSQLFQSAGAEEIYKGKSSWVTL